MSVKRTILLRLPIPELPGYESRMVKLEFPAGMRGLKHYHPAAGSNYVIKGSIISQFEGEEPQTFSAGETFIDFADKIHVRTDNASDTEELVVLVNYVIRVEEANVVNV